MKNKLFVAFTMLLLFSAVNFAQETDNKDLAMWNSIGVSYSPLKKLELGLEQHWRLKEDISVTDEYFTEIQASYKILKDLKFAAGVRFIKENDNVGKIQGYENHFRYQFDLSYKIDVVKRFDIAFRLRYQNKRETGLDESIEIIPTETLRFKTEFEYNIRKWPLDPEFAVEFFNRKREGAAFVGGAKLSRYRLTWSTSYNLKKFGKFGVYFRYQENTRVDNDFQTKILGLKYSYTIKGKSKSEPKPL